MVTTAPAAAKPALRKRLLFIDLWKISIIVCYFLHALNLLHHRTIIYQIRGVDCKDVFS